MFALYAAESDSSFGPLYGPHMIWPGLTPEIRSQESGVSAEHSQMWPPNKNDYNNENKNLEV